MRVEEIKEKGIKSRKFILTILGLSLLVFMALIVAKVPVVAPLYSTFVGGVLGALGLYMTGNVVNKYAMGKISQKEKEDGLD